MIVDKGERIERMQRERETIIGRRDRGESRRDKGERESEERRTGNRSTKEVEMMADEGKRIEK